VSACDPADEGPPDETSPQRELWANVIVQAWRDAFARISPERVDRRAREGRKARDEALAWLTATEGEDAEGREEVCALAGVDPDRLRERALARIAAVDAATSRKNPQCPASSRDFRRGASRRPATDNPRATPNRRPAPAARASSLPQSVAGAPLPKRETR
jgi:hypothetical protein